MKDDFYNEQFESRALTPVVWALAARRLRRSADLIFDRYESDVRAMEAGTSPVELDDLELAGCATLLYGLALENLLKAIVIQMSPKVIVQGRLRKWPVDGHDLLLLCKETELQIDSSETDQLARLTAFVRWAGRYPVPKSAPAMRLSQAAVTPDFVPLPLNPHERVPFDALYTRLETIVLRD